MANKTKAPAKQAQKKASKLPKTPETTTSQVESVEVENVNEHENGAPAANMSQFTTQNAIGSTKSRLSADKRVELLHLADDIFRKDPNAENRFPLQVRENINAIVAVGVVSAIADEAAFGNSTFSTVLKSTMYPQLVVAAHDMGIKLPDIKALPAGTEEGTVVVNSEQVELSEEAKKALEEEHNIVKDGKAGNIELDPVKVANMSEDDLKKALKYLMIDGPKTHHNINKGLVDAVDFMTAYRMEMARKAQNSTEAMNKYADRSMYEWLKDIFSYVPEPTFLVKGIGLGMKQLVSRDKHPINAFLIFRKALMDRETGTIVWDDQSIADATLAIVELVCNNEIAKEKKNIEDLDPKQKDYKTLLASYEKSIADYETIIKNMSEFDYTVCDRYLTEEGGKDMLLLKMFGNIMEQYYPLCDCQGSHFVNLLENLRQRAGIILNMFRSPGNTNQNYAESNLLDVYVQFPGGEKRTLEEWAAVGKKERDSMVMEAEKKEAIAEKKKNAKKA